MPANPTASDLRIPIVAIVVTILESHVIHFLNYGDSYTQIMNDRVLIHNVLLFSDPPRTFVV
jgi:hypothetical protein